MQFLYASQFHQGAVDMVYDFAYRCDQLDLVLFAGTDEQAKNANRIPLKLAREAELASLRQQLQPHFLFNSLNSISALAAQDLKKLVK